MISLPLYELSSGFSTNPSQPVIPVDDSFSVTEGEPTLVDPIANDTHLVTRGKSLVSVSSQVNCTAVVSGNLVNVTGTSVGAGSFSYTVSDGVSSVEGTAMLTVDSSGWLTVVVSDAAHTDFGDEVLVGDTLRYFGTTTITGAAVTVDAMGHVSLTGTYQAGDSFTYRVNAGAIQTFTFA